MHADSVSSYDARDENAFRGWMESTEAKGMHKTASTQSFDNETAAQPALPNLMRFPSACSTPVSSSDLIAMENLRKKASAGKGGDRPGRYGESHNQLWRHRCHDGMN